MSPSELSLLSIFISLSQIVILILFKRILDMLKKSFSFFYILNSSLKSFKEKFVILCIFKAKIDNIIACMFFFLIKTKQDQPMRLAYSLNALTPYSPYFPLSASLLT